jgi:S-adenosyl methyltransferase
LPTDPPSPPGVNTTAPSPARVYDYMLGGKDNYAVDRSAADTILAIAPEVRELAVHNREFLGRAVRFASACGITQFLDLGTGLPTQENVHQVAREVDESARVMYVDNDPIVSAHANALLCDNDRTVFHQGDVRDPEAILSVAESGGLLDLDRPVALLMVAILHFVADADDPAAIVARLVRELAPGSCVVVSHVTSEGAPQELRKKIDEVYGNAPVPLRLRSREQIAAMFGGLSLVPPGLVDVPYWRPERPVPLGRLRILGAVAPVPSR